jgi:hypothetical protein
MKGKKGTEKKDTITYQVFHHDLLITNLKLHYIHYKYDTDGIHCSKYMLQGYQKILLTQRKVMMKQ